jgi:hypothetical protein
VTTNRSVSVTNKLGRKAIGFCSCEITWLFPVLLCVVRVVYKLDFRIVSNEITSTNKWLPAEMKSCSDRYCMFFPHTVVSSGKGFHTFCEGQECAPE